MAKRFACTVEGIYEPDGFRYELTIPLIAMEVVQSKNTAIGLWDFFVSSRVGLA
jgi:hypothetical protein